MRTQCLQIRRKGKAVEKNFIILNPEGTLGNVQAMQHFGQTKIYAIKPHPSPAALRGSVGYRSGHKSPRGFAELQ